MDKIDPQRKLYECIWEGKAKYTRNMPLPLRVIAAASLLNGGKRLLDVACGDGSLAILVREKYDQIYGVEFASRAIDISQKRGVVVSNLNLNYNDLPYENNIFDAVTCLDIIEHVFDHIEGKKIEVGDFLDKEAALNLIRECTDKE